MARINKTLFFKAHIFMEHLMIKKNKIHHQTYLSLYVFKEKKNAIQNQVAHAFLKHTKYEHI